MFEPVDPHEPEIVDEWRRKRQWRLIRERLRTPRYVGVAALMVPLATLCVVAGSWALASFALMAGVVTVATMAAIDSSEVPALEGGAKLLTDGNLRDGVLPEDIDSDLLRARYLAIVRKRVRLERIVGDTDSLPSGLRGVLDACDAHVAEAGRLARETNHLERYLEDVQDIAGRDRAAQLQRRAEQTADIDACATFAHAAAVAETNAQLIEQLRGSLDRVQARLEDIEAMMDAAAARVVRVRAKLSETEEFETGRVEHELALVESAVCEACSRAPDDEASDACWEPVSARDGATTAQDRSSTSSPLISPHGAKTDRIDSVDGFLHPV